MTETPTPRPAGPIDPFAIGALLLGVVSFVGTDLVGYYPGLAVGVLAGIFGILCGIAGVAGARGRVLMPILAGVGGFLAFVGGAIALVGVVRAFSGA